MGPEAVQKFINPEEVIKRLAASQGIDVLQLIKTPQQLQQAKQEAMQMHQQQSLTDQAGQLASSPMADPTKNPMAAQMMDPEQQQTPEELQPPPEE